MARVNYFSFVGVYKAAYHEKLKAALFSSAQNIWNNVEKYNTTRVAKSSRTKSWRKYTKS